MELTTTATIFRSPDRNDDYQVIVEAHCQADIPEVDTGELPQIHTSKHTLVLTYRNELGELAEKPTVQFRLDWYPGLVAGLRAALDAAEADVERRGVPKQVERACRVCGCTEFDACQPPCHWVEVDLCSAPKCLAYTAAVRAC